MTRSKSNPFARSERYWKAVFEISADAAGTAENSFGDIALSVAAFETDEANHVWTFELLFGEAPDKDEIKRRLIVLAGVHGIAVPKLSVQEVEQRDWLAAVARSFPPMSIGRFYVHGAHVTDPPPVGALTIRVDAGAAFGSGEHGTTRACLQALDELAKKRDFTNILDMGCGSGILAIAAAKLWKAEVLAADIDPVAVRVTAENVKINRVQGHVESIVSDGYASDRIKKEAPFDLIISNILARPLVEFAPKLKRSLAKGGVVVLSGLLTSQESYVRSAHAAQGLKLTRRFVDGEWCTLVLE